MKCEHANKLVNNREHLDFYSMIQKDSRTMSPLFLKEYLVNSPTYRHHVFDSTNCIQMMKLSKFIEKGTSQEKILEFVNRNKETADA